jgi:beta-carotene 15,15'-dioxygenase
MADRIVDSDGVTRSERVGRSVIGCVACALLITACLVDRGLGTVDLLRYPGATAALLLLMGLPHGALDIELLLSGVSSPGRGWLAGSLLVYVGVVLGMLVFWWAAPAAALVALLGLSAYHFGGDWSGLDSPVRRLIVGSALLCAPTLAHAPAVAQIFSWLVPGDAASAIAGAMRAAAVLVVLGAAWIVGSRWRSDRYQCEEIIVVSIAAAVLQPLTFFTIYFCALHSTRHLVHVREKLSDRNTGDLLKRGAPYVSAALIGCGAGALLFPKLPSGVAFLSAAFVGLAALTVPHMILCDLPEILTRRRRATN